jgi:thiamine biosynthesis protein ThiS
MFVAWSQGSPDAAVTFAAVTYDYNEPGNDVSNAQAGNSPGKMISIVVNGQSREVPRELNVTGLLSYLGVDAARVAVERNRQVLRKAAWPDTPVTAGDQFEVVWFVGGG